MSKESVINDAKTRMKKAVDLLHHELKSVRTGQASTGLVENVRVDYYGSPTPINQVANISIPEPQLIVLKPFDPSIARDIEKAILAADVGLNPQSDGKVIRVPVPPLSEENRKKISHGIKDLGEQTKVALRNIRRDANKQLDDEKKEGTISEDEAYDGKDKIQKTINDYEKEVSEAVEQKTEEVMEV